GTTVTLIVSDGSQQQLTMPDLTGLTTSQAQQKMDSLGWKGKFNTNTVTTFDPSQDGLIKDQNPNVGSQIAKNQTVFITVQQLVGGGPSSTPGGGPGGGGGGGL
ncbi:MAG TPA: PASTA domain-containing protein, partial [Pseudonocardiaceae bacterium]|nr:PASTA domain-containing protein [Pseudonocardiaceae bacterium]